MVHLVGTFILIFELLCKISSLKQFLFGVGFQRVSVVEQLRIFDWEGTYQVIHRVFSNCTCHPTTQSFSISCSIPVLIIHISIIYLLMLPLQVYLEDLGMPVSI